MRTNLFYLLLITITIVSCKSNKISENKKYSQDFEMNIKKSINENATDLLSNPSIHSVSIGIYSKGKEITEHFGELDKGKGNKPTNNTIYEIASVTKTMTGTLVAKAVMEGKINLDDDIRNYMKGEYPNLSYKKQPIKIRHLLTHTSRLPSEIYGLDKFFQNNDMRGALKYANNYRKKEFFRDLKLIKIDTLPGTKYMYSANGANLLGYILEDIYNKTYLELLNETIFQKSGMKNTKLKLTEKDLEIYSNGYDGQGNVTPMQPSFLLGAEGQLKSNTSDLINYMKFQLDNENKIVKETRKQINANSAPMGYFWLIEDQNNFTFYKHPGTAIGTTNWFIICPKYDIGISVIVSSRFKGSVDIVYDKAINLMNDLIKLNKEE